jgi:CBS domain-containing protein
MRVRDIMSSPVVTVTVVTTVKHAADVLASNGFTALPVVDDDGGLIGIVTEVDLVRDRFLRDPRYRHAYEADVAGPDGAPHAPAATVGAVMTTPVIGMGVGTDVVDVVTAMLDDRARSIPIVDGSRVVGIVTRRDLVRMLARDDQAIAADVRHRLAMYGVPDRWTVAVCDGVVAIGDEFDNPTDRHVAAVLAEAVSGVTRVRVTSHAATD